MCHMEECRHAHQGEIPAVGIYGKFQIDVCGGVFYLTGIVSPIAEHSLKHEGVVSYATIKKTGHTEKYAQ